MRMLKLYATLILTLSGHLLGFGQTYFLQRQTNSIYVAFSDQALSASVKEAIVADLSICFQGWATNAEIIVREKGESAGHMDYGTRNPYYRDGVIFPKNIITNATGGIALQIPQPLSDAYTNALAFVAANSNIVAAAYEFVAFVSSSNFVAISSNALPNYVLPASQRPVLHWLLAGGAAHKRAFSLAMDTGFNYSAPENVTPFLRFLGNHDRLPLDALVHCRLRGTPLVSRHVAGLD